MTQQEYAKRTPEFLDLLVKKKLFKEKLLEFIGIVRMKLEACEGGCAISFTNDGGVLFTEFKEM